MTNILASQLDLALGAQISGTSDEMLPKLVHGGSFPFTPRGALIQDHMNKISSMLGP
jgi:hypothetical protein